MNVVGHDTRSPLSVFSSPLLEGPPFFPPFGSDAFPPDDLAATDYDDYSPGGGGGGFVFPGGPVPADAYPGPRHFE